MDISVIYESRDFWGQTIQKDEEKPHAGKDDIQKAFRFLKGNHDTALHIAGYIGDESLSIFWDSFSDKENEIVTVRIYESWNNFDELKMSFEKAKRFVKVRVGLF